MNGLGVAGATTQAAGQIIDRRELPRYSVSDVALYLHIAEKTLRSWLYGRPYPQAGGMARTRPLIEPADSVGSKLSFYNLVEAHILKCTRQRDEVPMVGIREALDYATKRYTDKHPLITMEFETEGSALFERRLGEIVNASKHGQLTFEPLISSYLQRIDRDSFGAPSVLYPFIPGKPQSKVVAIKPGVSSGVPTVAGTGISVAVLCGRRAAGDSIANLADDYDLTETQVEEAIEYLAA